MAFAETAPLTVELRLKDGLSAGLRNASKSLSQFDSATGRTQRSLQGIGRNIERFGVVAAAGFVAAGVASVKLASDFEAQLNVINTIAQKTPPELKSIGDGIRSLARSSGADLEDLTSAYYDLLSAGVQVQDAQGLLVESYKLGRGALGTTKQAVDVLTTALNSYQGSTLYAGKSTQQLANIFGDQLAQAVADGKVTIDQISQSFSQVAPLAAQAGIGLDQIAASYGLITAKGSDAAETTTQMARAIIEILKPGKDLEDLQSRLHLNFQDLIRDKGLVPTLQIIRDAAEKTGVPFQDLFGRLEGLRFVLSSTGVNFDQYSAEMAKITASTGALDKQVSARNQGLAYQMGILQAVLKDIGITIGTALLPKLTPLVAKLNDFLNGHQGDIAKFGDDLAGAFGKIGTFLDTHGKEIGDFGKGLFDGLHKFGEALAQVDLQPFINGLKLAGDIAKKAVDIFNSLPPELRNLLVAGFAINKLTSGLLSSVVQDLTGFVLKSLTTITAGNVTVIGANVTGGAGAAGAVGGVGKLASAVRIIGAVTIAAGSLFELAQVFSDVTGGARQQAQDVHTQSQAQIAAPNTTTADLQKAFAATRTGIDQINGMGPLALLFSDTLSELERQNNDIVIALRKRGIDPTADPTKHIAGDENIGRRTFDAGRPSQVFLKGKAADDLTLIRSSASSLPKLVVAENRFASALKSGLAGLAKATSKNDIRAQAKKIVDAIVHGAGNARNTTKAIDELKAAQAKAIASGDKGLAAELGRQVARVEAKLPNRQFVQRQYDAAKGILASSEATAKKTADLKSIQAQLLARGDTKAAALIGGYIDRLKTGVVGAVNAQAIAARQTTEAIKDKDLSVTVPVTVNTTANISLAGIQASVSRQARLTKIIGGSQQMGGP